MGWYLISFSALSALLGVLYTTGQRDLKRLLGYSPQVSVQGGVERFFKWYVEHALPEERPTHAV